MRMQTFVAENHPLNIFFVVLMLRKRSWEDSNDLSQFWFERGESVYANMHSKPESIG